MNLKINTIKNLLSQFRDENNEKMKSWDLFGSFENQVPKFIDGANLLTIQYSTSSFQFQGIVEKKYSWLCKRKSKSN